MHSKGMGRTAGKGACGAAGGDGDPGEAASAGGPGPERPPAGAISRTPGCAGDRKDRLEEEGMAAGAGGAVRSVRKLSGRETRRWRSQ